MLPEPTAANPTLWQRVQNQLCWLSVALGFLTTLPVPVRDTPTAADMARATAYFPLVGLWLGLLLAGADTLLGRIFPNTLQATLTLAFWIALSGALHLDGFIDCCDGLLAPVSPERRLEILRDVHVGAFGVVGAVTLLLIKLAALVSLPVSSHIAALLLAPTLGRWGMTLSIAAFPYARAEGLGRAMKAHSGWKQTGFATATAIAAAWFAKSWLGLAAALLAVVATWASARFVLGRLPGLTGDIYGAICEVVEVLVLLFFAAEVGL